MQAFFGENDGGIIFFQKIKKLLLSQKTFVNLALKIHICHELYFEICLHL